ncbi:putative sensory transduction system, regulatory protein [Shewanella sediminis HAW-EB3]|uniref:diguanylate cyclase n=1 Tax=Shewanella sediminis (strain HAW-EB3) TaxID=425104 RepID=A8FZW5_SHESH|nr:CHASE domain-containing protein [Shewanella sediminis]ABV38388.1 putative sensory transduction system, regulatory protein [Shewanella sediminis HAW-EB3]
MPISNSYTRYIILFSVSIGILLSGLIGYSFYQKETQAIEADFRSDVDDKASALERELLLKSEVLYALKGLFDSSENVTAQEFNRLASGFLIRHQDIQALEWIPKVIQDHRDAYEQAGRRMHPDFEFTERESQGRMVRASERAVYFPVYYAEPLKGNEVALGFDLASDEKRLKIINKSRDLDLSLATESIRLVQETSDQRGVLVFMPIYDGEPTTLKKRREKFLGFVLGVYRIGEIFEAAVRHTSVQGLNLSLIDNTGIEAAQLYANFSTDQAQGMASVEFNYSKPLRRFGGRQWTLVATPSLGYVVERRSLLPLMSGSFCILFVLLVGAYLYAVMKHSVLIEAEVFERTQALHKAKQALKDTALIDGLTKVANRRQFDAQYETEWLRAIRDGSSLSLIMIEVDHFKLYKAHYGDSAGDQCLKDVVKEISNTSSRNSDLVARYSGEQLAILLPNTEEPAILADKCLSNVEKLYIPHEDSPVSEYVTISLGVMTIIPTQRCDPDDFISKTIAALMEAKESGRNRVFVGDKAIQANQGEIIDFKSPKGHSPE